MSERRAELGFARPSRAGTVILAVAALAVLGTAAFSVIQSTSSAGHSAHSVAAPPVVDDGLDEFHDGFRLELLGSPPSRGPAVPISFRILDSGGRPVTAYDLEHTKLLHFYVLRDDMVHYQHLHPSLEADTWHTTISVPDGGQYRLYAEFLARGRANPLHPTVLGAPFTVPGDTALVPLPAPAASADAGGLLVTRPEGAEPVPVQKVNQLRFRVTDISGRPVDRLDPYLGAAGHLSAFNSLTMGLLHQHPLGSDLTFSAQFAKRGEHRLFLEFSVAGQLHRAEFTVFVT